MEVARRLWELSHGQASGALRLDRPDGATAALSVELSRGWVYGVDLSPAWSRVGDAPVQGAERLRLLLSLTVGAGTDSYQRMRWESPAPPPRRGPVQPFHPAAALRNHVEKQEQSPWRVRAGTFLLREPPHPSCVGQDERPLLAFLSHPRTADDVDRYAASLGGSSERTLRLLSFLDAVGALDVTIDSSPFAVLGLDDGASPDEVRQAYKRLAKELHPDRHPNAGADELRELERRFAEVSAAYRRLV